VGGAGYRAAAELRLGRVIERTIPASAGQRLLWMMDHYRPELGALSCPVLVRIGGNLREGVVADAVAQLIERHESLRTTFTGRGPRLTQQIRRPTAVPVHEVDLAAEADPEMALDTAIAAELASRIDVASWPLRAVLWRLGPAEHVFCLNTHHLVTDAWSSGVLYGELAAILGGQKLPPPTWQFADFMTWQEKMLAGSDADRLRRYWRRQLAGAHSVELPELADSQASRSGVAAAFIEPQVVAALAALAKAERTTPFAIYLSLFYLTLYRLTGQGDLAVASLFANRSRPMARGVVGFLANMVLLRTRLSLSATLTELVQQSHRCVTGAFLHQELPLQLLPRDTLHGSGRAEAVVFQAMPGLSHRRRAGELELDLLVPEHIGARFDSELTVVPVRDGCRVLLFYMTNFLGPTAAEHFVADYTTLAGTLAAEPRRRTAELAG
jgi:hypothetical protein